MSCNTTSVKAFWTLICLVAFVICVSIIVLAQTYTSAGSGFIITGNGYILTNYHVVAGATESISVRLQDGTEYEATLIDYSPTMDEAGSDIALLKIAAHGLPALPVADSDVVQLFDKVIAMGYPLTFSLGVNLNVTGGNITAFRDFEDSPELFQLDAAINPGNSGGPVLNEKGQVIGIATSRITHIEETPVQGVSFAVPIENAQGMLKRNISGWNLAYSHSPVLLPRDIVSKSAPAVVYITWSETYLDDGEYAEDFSVKKDWYAEYWNDGGFIEVALAREGYAKGVSCPCEASVSNFEVDIVFTHHSNGEAGLTILAPEGNKWHYAIVFDPDGWYAYYTRSPEGDTWSILQSRWRNSKSINTGIRVLNRLKLEVHKWITYVYFNGHAVGTLNAPVSLGGGIEFTVVNFGGTTTARFDNLRIYEPKSASILD